MRGPGIGEGRVRPGTMGPDPGRPGWLWHLERRLPGLKRGVHRVLDRLDPEDGVHLDGLAALGLLAVASPARKAMLSVPPPKAGAPAGPAGVGHRMARHGLVVMAISVVCRMVWPAMAFAQHGVGVVEDCLGDGARRCKGRDLAGCGRWSESVAVWLGNLSCAWLPMNLGVMSTGGMVG